MKTLVLLFLLIFTLTGCQSGAYQGPVSDHFNGTRFYNPGEEHERSIADLYHQGRSIHENPWPASLPAIHYQYLVQTGKHNGIKITFVNHATVLIQAKNLNILTDPVWSYRASPFSWIGPARVRPPGIEFSNLPKIDVVLISHNHYDHLDIETLQKLNEKFHPVFIVPLGNKNFLNHYKIYNVVELDWWQKYDTDHAHITFLPAQHWATRWLLDTNKTLWGSYGIEINNVKIYFGGDTGYSNHFKTIRAKWGSPDFALLPIGSYERRSQLKFVHLNPKDAVTAHNDLDSTASIGIHYGTFQLSSESLDQPINDLSVAKKKLHVSDNKFFILRQGGSWYLSRD